MPEHTWMRPQNVAAICPKCGQPTLRRSHSHWKFEKFRKKYSLKRPFRCHNCHWRGWINETELRYPLNRTEFREWDSISDDSEIPNIDLEGELGYAGEQKFNDVNSGSQEWRRRPVHNTSPSTDPEGTPEPIRKGSTQGLIDLGSEQDVHPFSHAVADDFHRATRHKSQVCPGCGEYSLHRSRVRSIFEAFRRRFSKKRPYRCHKCGWRGWIFKEV
jgi:predicted RNA-binding Zn-ribbon protein involved in translation (DUF1610 family)